jgi:hypothetical protein
MTGDGALFAVTLTGRQVKNIRVELPDRRAHHFDFNVAFGDTEERLAELEPSLFRQGSLSSRPAVTIRISRGMELLGEFSFDSFEEDCCSEEAKNWRQDLHHAASLTREAFNRCRRPEELSPQELSGIGIAGAPAGSEAPPVEEPDTHKTCPFCGHLCKRSARFCSACRHKW